MPNDPVMTPPGIHRLAVLTTVLSLLPIVLGAMTTTQDAGMAFPDWPTSDGQGMFSYPWLRLMGDMGTNRESYDKFLEHGHRLAGIVIGLSAIALAVACSRKNSPRHLMLLAISVLVAVILQGLLGGYRVELNQRGLAMFHGFFASLVFSLMCVTCTVASPAWTDFKLPEESARLKTASYGTLLFFLFLLVQYALGGLIRHPIGTRAPIHEHLGLGVLAVVLVHVLLFVIVKTRSAWLRQAMRWVLLAVAFQFLLGLVTYAAKFGIPSLGIIAVAQSTGQVLSRTGHMVTGVLVIGSAAVLMARCFRLWMLASRQAELTPVPGQAS